ncbi:MAG: three-helix bundle dimerization domain-containing protein [Pyrinomonadaceae bacterium]
MNLGQPELRVKVAGDGTASRQVLHQGVEMEGPNYHANDELIDLVWRDMNELIPRARVSQTISEVSERYNHAKITAFIPNIVRRMTRERLQKELQRA